MANDRTPSVAANQVLALYASLLSATSLAAAAHQLVSQLALLGGFTRVVLALHEDGRTWLLASSSTDLAPTNATASAQLLLAAIDEAIDQGVPLCWPLPDTDNAVAPADWIRLEHRQWQQDIGGAVASLPLGTDGTVFAAVSVQRDGTAVITEGEIQQLAQWLSLAAPALRWMRYGEQTWYQRLRRGLVQTISDLRQPRRRSTRALLLAGLLVLAFITLVPIDYAVSGRARVEGAQQRVLSAPSDGFIRMAHVRPGDRVKAGAPLVDLIDEDLQLEQDRWRSQLAQHENAYAAAMAKSDRVGASTSFERVNEAQAQLALIAQQRTRGRITAPFDALVVQGDLSQSMGAPVRQGDALLTLASTDHYRVVVDVDETDIAQVRAGQPGQLVLSSLQWQHAGLQVERITPLARAVEGRNIFEVQARLTQVPDGLRPGLVGRADVVVGRLPLVWGWSRHALMRIRLAWWSWVG